jgi:tRNA threonylcarbamoyl adenosine modification protein YeaZ
MLNILIDTSNKKCCLALAKNQHIFKTKILTNHNNLTDIIVEHLSKLLISAQLEPNNIHNVYLVNGPGSFTGVRVGCMLAKALATIYKLKIYVIDSLY